MVRWALTMMSSRILYPRIPPIRLARHDQGLSDHAPERTGRRQSIIRLRDTTSRPPPENGRDSISSRDSWIRRLSIRPLSQHGGSERSSLVFEPSSYLSSYLPGPARSACRPSARRASHHNHSRMCWMKRESAEEKEKSRFGPLKRRMSKSRMPTLRRPNTSHQRSATVQQFQHQGGFSGPPAASAPKYSLDQTTHPSDLPLSPAVERLPGDALQSASKSWTSYFHSPGLSPESTRLEPLGRGRSPNSQTLPNRRLSLQPGSISRAFPNKTRLVDRSARAAGKYDKWPGWARWKARRTPKQTRIRPSRPRQDEPGGPYPSIFPSAQLDLQNGKHPASQAKVFRSEKRRHSAMHPPRWPPPR